METKGKVIEILESISGTSSTGKDWTKQTFVIEEIEGNYPKKVAIDAFNKDIGVNIGDTINAFVNIESREVKGKWYTNVGLWKTEIIDRATPTSDTTVPPSSNEPMETDDLPF